MISPALCEAFHCWEGTLLIKQKAKDGSCSTSGRGNFYCSSPFCCCSLTVILTLLAYACELWTKGEFLYLISLLDVIFQQYILQLPEQNGSALVSHIASQLEKYNDVLMKTDQIWMAFLVASSMKHNSLFIQGRELYFYLHLSISTNEPFHQRKIHEFDNYILPTGCRTPVASPTCMTLCLRDLETEQHYEKIKIPLAVISEVQVAKWLLLQKGQGHCSGGRIWRRPLFAKVIAVLIVSKEKEL